MERTSTANDLTEAAEETAGERTPGDRGVDRERAGAARRELAARREERAAYNRRAIRRRRPGGCASCWQRLGNGP